MATTWLQSFVGPDEAELEPAVDVGEDHLVLVLHPAVRLDAGRSTHPHEPRVRLSASRFASWAIRTLRAAKTLRQDLPTGCLTHT